MLGSLQQISGVAVQSPKVVVRLNVCGIDLQDPLEFDNGLGGLSVFGEQSPEVVTRADQIRIDLERGIEFSKRLVTLSGTAEHDSEHVVRDCRARRSAYRRPRGA